MGVGCFFVVKLNKVKFVTKNFWPDILFEEQASNKRPCCVFFQIFLWRQWIIDLLSLNLATMIWQTKKFVQQLIPYLWENLWKSIQKSDNLIPSTFHNGKNFRKNYF